jgi:hypothetical protein
MADNRVWVYGGNNRGRGDYRGVGVNKKGGGYNNNKLVLGYILVVSM